MNEHKEDENSGTAKPPPPKTQPAQVPSPSSANVTKAMPSCPSSGLTPQLTAKERRSGAESLSASTPSARGELVEKAKQIRSAGTHPASRNQRTIAVGEDAEGNLYAGSSNGFDSGQQQAAESLGIKPVRCMPQAHAEENLMREVSNLKRVGTSVRVPCGASEHNCRGQLISRGIKIDNE